MNATQTPASATPASGARFRLGRVLPAVLMIALAMPVHAADLLKQSLVGPMKGCREIVFAMRGNELNVSVSSRNHGWKKHAGALTLVKPKAGPGDPSTEQDYWKSLQHHPSKTESP